MNHAAMLRSTEDKMRNELASVRNQYHNIRVEGYASYTQRQDLIQQAKDKAEQGIRALDRHRNDLLGQLVGQPANVKQSVMGQCDMSRTRYRSQIEHDRDMKVRELEY